MMKTLINLPEKTQEIVKVIIINLALIFILVESLSLAYFFLRTQRIYYRLSRQEKQQEISQVDINLTGIRLDRNIVERLHPFFGFIMEPGPDFREGFDVNNYGFISPYNYPYIRQHENQYLIGVFGGSVAQSYAINEIETKILEKRLKELPDFANKEIIIIPFTTGGYKQPQQLLILNYFLSIGQELDMVINMDGFNEVALSYVNHQNDIDIAMPSGQHIIPLANLANNSLSATALKTLLKIQDQKEKLSGGVTKLENCKLAFCHTFNAIYINKLANNYRRDIKRFERARRKREEDSYENNVIYYNKTNTRLPDAILFEEITRNWLNASLLIHQITSQRNILYFHILQPNQYYQTQRIFTADEQKTAFSDDSDYGKAVKIGYPKLITKIDELKRNGVQFINTVNSFDQIKETIYIDSCCHYNDVGEDIISSDVATSIVQFLTQP